jgi:outer membrane receptor protein involved in Fe transport
MQPIDRLEAEAGLRVDHQAYSFGASGTQWSPRLNLRYRQSPQLSLYASWGQFTQAQRPNEWRLEENQQAPDPAQTASHEIAGLTREMGAASWRLEMYRKYWSHVSPYQDNLLNSQTLLPDLAPDRVRIAPRSAESKGVELSVRGALGVRWQYWTSYAWSQVSDHIQGEDVPRSWDQRSAVNAGVGWKIATCAVSATARYHSGWPRTPVLILERTSALDPLAQLAGRNTGRWPDYFSADLRASRTWLRGAGELQVFLEVTNVTNRDNVSSLTLVFDGPAATASSSAGYWMPRAYNVGLTWTVH